jgi:WD40 repeat protein
VNPGVICSVAFVFIVTVFFPGHEMLRSGEAKKPGEPALVLQSFHHSSVSSMCFSPDGKWLVTGGHDGEARLWELSTGRLVRIFRGHTNNIYDVSLSRDGKWLATASIDKSARVWELATGKEIRMFRGHTDSLTAVSISGDGKVLATGSYDGTARIWNVETGKQLQSIEHDNRIKEPPPKGSFRLTDHYWITVVLSDDGKKLMTGCGNNPACLWEAASGKKLRDFGNKSVGGLAFSGDGRWLATAGDKTVRLWNMDGAEVRTFEHKDEVLRLRLSPDGKWLATGGGIGLFRGDVKSLRVWDATSGKQTSEFGPSDWVKAMDLSDDGKTVAATFHELNISVGVWEAATGRQSKSISAAKTIGCRNLTVMADGGWLATTNGYGNSIHLWDLAKGAQTRVLKTRFYTDPALQFSKDGKHLVAGYGGHASQWNVADGQITRELKGQSDHESLALSSDGKLLFTGSDLLKDKDLETVQIWNLVSGKKERAIDAHAEGISSLALSADDKWLVTGGQRDGKARLWNAVTGEHLRDFQGPEKWHNVVVFTKNTEFLVTTSGKDHSILLWEVTTGRQVREFKGHSRWITSLAVSGDGKWLITGSDDRTARLWEIVTGKEKIVFRGHSERVTQVALVSDGKRLVTASYDGSIRIWNIETGAELCQLVSFDDGGWAVFDHDGRFDGANGGNVDGLHWVVGLETFPLAHFKNQRHDPGLLAKHLGMIKEPLREFRKAK